MGAALVTPFKSDLTIDHDALSKIVSFNIDNGTDYLVISGTTGESVTITKDEKRAIVETIVKTNAGRLPLVIGIGGNNTAEVIEELKTTDLSPFVAVLSVAPYYSKPTKEGLYQHFKAVAEASSIPVILYNVPGRTAKNMEPDTSLRLARDIDNIVAIKEAGNSPEQYKALIQNKPKDFMVISGDDDLVCDVVLSGGSVVISVIGQALPALFSNMIHKGISGDEQAAKALEKSAMPLIGLIFEENNPAGIKAVLEQLGLCNDTVRLPLVTATEGLKLKIKNALAEL